VTVQKGAEVANLMIAQSDIDASRIQGSYSILKVFLWPVPILGFIGTVLGLSESIAVFGEIDASDTEALTETIGSVTSGLGTVFNTTLLGLVLSVFMAFPIAAVQKTSSNTLRLPPACATKSASAKELAKAQTISRIPPRPSSAPYAKSHRKKIRTSGSTSKATASTCISTPGTWPTK